MTAAETCVVNASRRMKHRLEAAPLVLPNNARQEQVIF
jgi:hypothetical protein